MMHPSVEKTCRICYGTKVWKGGATEYPCTSCKEPEPAIVRKALLLLTPEQMAFLRQYGHTLANQPITEEEWDAMPRQLYVEGDDAVYDTDYEQTVLVPATAYWFAGAQARLFAGKNAQWFHYSPLGLALRECLMAGADAGVPS